MAQHYQIFITWNVQHGATKGAGILPHHAQSVLVDAIDLQGAELDITPLAIGDEDSVLQMVWSFDMHAEGIFGTDPAKAVAYLENALIEQLSAPATLEVQVWREADFSEAIDHADICAFYKGEATKEDYPTFRPQTHPDWPEANEVFFQDGYWGWNETDGDISTGPAFGPKPERIYSLWSPEKHIMRDVA